MKKIVIINAYGKNVGDAAIIDATVRLIKNTIHDISELHIHAATPDYPGTQIKTSFGIKVIANPYGSAIKNKKGRASDSTKILRFTSLMLGIIIQTLLGKLNISLISKKPEYVFIKSLKEADLVLGLGGGYLRTKSKYRDFFGLTLTLLPILITHFYKKKILFLPMSFGNFATPVHKWMAFLSVKNDRIIFRDKISYSVFQNLSKDDSNILLLPDLALFNKKPLVRDKTKSKYIVLTAREWLDEEKQTKYESALAQLIEYVWSRYGLRTYFIPMAWNEIDDDDTIVGRRILNMIDEKEIFKILPYRYPKEVQKLLSNAELAVCTRMHSAILATTVGTPFISIAYEHKTHGFLKSLGLSDWNIDIEDATFLKLKQKVDKLINTEHESYRAQLIQEHKKTLSFEKEIIKEIERFDLSQNNHE